jgi:hypothetical protein
VLSLAADQVGKCTTGPDWKAHAHVKHNTT